LKLLEWVSGGGDLQSATASQASTDFSLMKPITLTVSYSETEMPHLDETQLTLHRWDSDEAEWHPLPTVVDTVENVVTAHTQSLGGFDLQTSLLCTSDELEPDDGYQAALQVRPNESPLSRSLDIGQDSDWVSLEAVQGVTYTISTQNLADGVDTVLNLYDPKAAALLNTDDDGGGEQASRLTWAAPYTGNFFIETVSAPGGLTGCSATYELVITTDVAKVYLPLVLRRQ
jgi:hypothetical protein